MSKFIYLNIVRPLSGKWFRGAVLLLFWTIAFIALPAISGWFLAMSSVVFLTAGIGFSYLVPSAIVRLLTLMRTATRYFERLENHKTTLEAQSRLQLKIFSAVARFPYFKKQVNNNSAILENSTFGIDLILNHILLWLLPFAALIISIIVYAFFILVFSQAIALEFLVSSAILLFVIPQFIFISNRKLYAELKILREENNLSLIQSFRGRIEISKYQLEQNAIHDQEQSRHRIEQLESRLQKNSFTLQLLAGMGFSIIAAFVFWNAGNYDISAPVAIGLFFGIMAQAELAEMLFAGKSERSSVAHQEKDIELLLRDGESFQEPVPMETEFISLHLTDFSACIPETRVTTEPFSLEVSKGEWIALYGETGRGKTTLLNSLFYPEYRLNGSMSWNNVQLLSSLPVPECIYVTQKAYLLTGTLRENFEGYTNEQILEVLSIVDLFSWFSTLPDGLETWLGENGETLSGGQRKKLLLAQALLKKPSLLVVDEPTAGISTSNALTIFRSIKQNYPDVTVLMATHLMEMEREVDKVVRI
jgi:ATP-binding cassette subfamily C protein CydC